MGIKLCDPPQDKDKRELWIQHAAGMILFEDARNYAISQIPKGTDPSTTKQIIEGIDNAIYGMMMIFDGVTGSLQNADYEVKLEGFVSLIRKEGDSLRVIERLNLFDGDGMCMGFHSWLESDFGQEPVTERINLDTKES